MKRSQAMQNWCPEVRMNIELKNNQGNMYVVTINRVHLGPDNVDIPVGARCIAEHCMMWRETASVPRVTEAEGYCGKAGVPPEPSLIATLS